MKFLKGMLTNNRVAVLEEIIECKEQTIESLRAENSHLRREREIMQKTLSERLDEINALQAQILDEKEMCKYYEMTGERLDGYAKKIKNVLQSNYPDDVKLRWLKGLAASAPVLHVAQSRIKGSDNNG